MSGVKLYVLGAVDKAAELTRLTKQRETLAKGIGAIEAMSSAGVNLKTKVTAGFDATPDAFAYMKDGKLGATIDQYPGQQAGQALSFLVDYIKNKKTPPQPVVYIAPKAVMSAP